MRLGSCRAQFTYNLRFPGQYYDAETGLSQNWNRDYDPMVGRYFYVHTDHLNTPRKIAQPSSGTLAWRWDADPFGTAAPNSNPGGLGTFIYNLRYPGQYYDSETGLNYNYFRDYDPQTGRYVESDPIGLQGGSYSAYAYADDMPTSIFDPLGLWGLGDPLPQGMVDSVTGFGDAFLIPQAVRAAFDLNGSIDQCSTAYKAGEITGTIWGLLAAGAEPLALAADRTALNANQYFRIGLGRWGKDMVPRVSSPYLGHYRLTSRIPPIPPIGWSVAPACGCK
jgi:RHS repeat-associated protein